MNLYKHVFTHYAPKDSEYGIKKYFLAENDEEAFLKVYSFGSCLTIDIIENKETQEYEGKKYYYIDGKEYPLSLTIEEAKQIIIKARGEMFMEDMSLQDLYYGRTYEGWELIQENLTTLEIEVLKDLIIK